MVDWNARGTAFWTRPKKHHARRFFTCFRCIGTNVRMVGRGIKLFKSFWPGATGNNRGTCWKILEWSVSLSKGSPAYCHGKRYRIYFRQSKKMENIRLPVRERTGDNNDKHDLSFQHEFEWFIHEWFNSTCILCFERESSGRDKIFSWTCGMAERSWLWIILRGKERGTRWTLDKRDLDTWGKYFRRWKISRWIGVYTFYVFPLFTWNLSF